MPPSLHLGIYIYTFYISNQITLNCVQTADSLADGRSTMQDTQERNTHSEGSLFHKQQCTTKLLTCVKLVAVNDSANLLFLLKIFISRLYGVFIYSG